METEGFNPKEAANWKAPEAAEASKTRADQIIEQAAQARENFHWNRKRDNDEPIAPGIPMVSPVALGKVKERDVLTEGVTELMAEGTEEANAEAAKLQARIEELDKDDEVMKVVQWAALGEENARNYRKLFKEDKAA